VRGVIEHIGQLDLFPRANQQDLIQAKKLLIKYKWFQKMIASLEVEKELNEKEKSIYESCQRNIRNLDRAVNLILDPEVKDVIVYRYIEGNSHKLTVIKFTSAMDDRTVDRKISKGIESIAETLIII
jgi:hypothetical protein